MSGLRDRLVARVLLGLAWLYDFGPRGTLLSGYFVRVDVRRTWSLEYTLRQAARGLAKK